MNKPLIILTEINYIDLDRVAHVDPDPVYVIVATIERFRKSDHGSHIYFISGKCLHVQENPEKIQALICP